MNAEVAYSQTKYPITDEQLVNLFNSTQQNVYFAQLYGRYYDKVVRKCLHFTQDSMLAEDIAQDIFLKLIHKLVGFRGQASFSTWLNSIIYHACVDHLRGQKVRREIGLDAGWEFERVSEEEPVELTQQQLEQFYEGLHQLKPGDQMLLRLKYEEGLSIGVLARLHKVSESALKMRLKRARYWLRTTLSRHAMQNEKNKCINI